MKRARFVVDPQLLLRDILPPGNTLTGCAVTGEGMIVFEFEGNDVPEEIPGTPMLMLMGCSTALDPDPTGYTGGPRSYWFEPPRIEDEQLVSLLFPSDPAA
jgi:hypothetical protein